MVNSEMSQMHEKLWDQLTNLNPQETAIRSQCRYIKDRDSYLIRMLNKEYEVNLTNRRVAIAGTHSEPRVAGYLQQLCILVYLIHAQNLPLANIFVKGTSFPGGLFFFRGLHSLPTDKLIKAFGTRPALLKEAIESLKAEEYSFGDASARITVLPRIPLLFVTWGSNDEFDASASILFDKTASEHLPLDALWAAVNLTVEEVMNGINKYQTN